MRVGCQMADVRCQLFVVRKRQAQLSLFTYTFATLPCPHIRGNSKNPSRQVREKGPFLEPVPSDSLTKGEVGDKDATAKGSTTRTASISFRPSSY